MNTDDSSTPRGRNVSMLLIGGFALFFLLAANSPALAFSTNDAGTMFSAYNSAFYLQNGTNGIFKNSQTDASAAYFWGQAETIECVIDAYEWSSNATAQVMITNLLNGFIHNNTGFLNNGVWTGDSYNDDIMWAVIAFARGGMDTGMTNYCNIAKANFDAVYSRAWDSNFGGGLWWTTSKGYKNAAVNGPGSIAASLLYQIYGDSNYWNKATNIYYWERSVLFNTNTGAIYDGIATNGGSGVVNGGSLTYNQGTFIGAADFLGQTNDAALAANYTMMDLTSLGILPQYGLAGNNSGFNAIFLRWMTRFMKNHNLQSTYEPWLQLNAAAAWNGRRSDNLSWCQWPQPTPAGTNFFSWDCISSFEALQAANPSQVEPPLPVPTADASYWPLDATSGTAATDVSGNGNNGTVSGASWSANGLVNGCLVFNGVNSSVQITNPLVNDFSIAFWVKTSQTAGAPEWYNGAGLVDGDYPGTANDFGTALVGSKFGFGIGNPDTTILSTTSINDGAWHFCVATRQQATGAIKVYVDGSLQASATVNRNSLNASAHLLFGAIASGGGYFNGSLDEVKLFTRALSSGEVAALYDSLRVPPLTAPADLTATTTGNRQVQLNWSAASASTSYNVKRSLINGGPYVVITNVTATGFTDTTVANNLTYYYVVSAVNVAGEGANSAPASASPSALVAWLKADAIAGLANGAALSTWADASGNGDNAVQPSSANQPVYVTGAMNGLPVVRFNAAQSSYLWFYRSVKDDFTIICVFQSTQGYGSGNLYYQGAGLVNAEVTGVVNDFGSCLFANGVVCAGTGNPDVAATSGSGYNNGHPHIMTFTRTESSGQVLLYMDGKLASLASGGKQSLTAPNQLVLGAQQTLNNFLTGDIAEVQIFNAVLPASELSSRENALKCKYGIAGSTAPIPPTGLTGTAGNREISLNWVLTPGATDYNLLRSTDNGATYQPLATGLTTSSYVDTSAINGQTNFYEVAASDSCGAGANTATLGVFLPLPSLGMNVSANALSISWPGWANDWSLYVATNLTPPVVWMPVTNLVNSNNGVFNMTSPIGSVNQFFRLASP
ncbi:MAG TPA: glycoside hydrolase family 76 protein [Candidatus Angelobacter sp.]|nr:glycoside hydrolase family 76 protein [Candidatus Angelobacter sp.]